LNRTFEFWFDLGSPAAYIAWKRLPAFEKRTGATAIHKPMLLGGVFKAQGNASPVTIPAKGKWILADLGRAAQKDGIPLSYGPSFPINTLPLMRAVIGTQMRAPARFTALVDALFDAMFATPKDLREPAVIKQVLETAGFDATQMLELTGDPEVKQALIKNTEEAVAKGIFGAPSFIVGGTLFWGQDRMDAVAEALAA
jgi:2-hydroxychromene-2-carboxylate isomerase